MRLRVAAAAAAVLATCSTAAAQYRTEPPAFPRPISYSLTAEPAVQLAPSDRYQLEQTFYTQLPNILVETGHPQAELGEYFVRQHVLSVDVEVKLLDPGDPALVSAFAEASDAIQHAAASWKHAKFQKATLSMDVARSADELERVLPSFGVDQSIVVLALVSRAEVTTSDVLVQFDRHPPHRSQLTMRRPTTGGSAGSFQFGMRGGQTFVETSRKPILWFLEDLASWRRMVVTHPAIEMLHLLAVAHTDQAKTRLALEHVQRFGNAQLELLSEPFARLDAGQQAVVGAMGWFWLQNYARDRGFDLSEADRARVLDEDFPGAREAYALFEPTSAGAERFLSRYAEDAWGVTLELPRP